MKQKRGLISLSMEQLIYVLLTTIVLVAAGLAAKQAMQNFLK